MAVCPGQIYVGSGYREMAAQYRELSHSLQNLLLKSNFRGMTVGPLSAES